MHLQFDKQITHNTFCVITADASGAKETREIGRYKDREIGRTINKGDREMLGQEDRENNKQGR